MLGTSEKRSPDVEETDQKIKVVIVDIEGTTTSISFVKDTLFPYIRENLESYLKEHWDAAELMEDLVLLRNQAEKDKMAALEGFVPIPVGNGDETLQAVVKNVLWQMDLDRKTQALKQIQGHVMKKGYLSGRLKGHVYDDVQSSLRSWTHSGRDVYVYSSGSVAAQKLLFGYSEQGDLLEFISGHFDTEVGPKVEASSYSKIATKLNCKSNEIMFLTDIPGEATAASEAGLNAVLVSRPGNAPLTGDESTQFRVIKSFHDIVFETSAKRKKLSVDEECTSDTVQPGSSENDKKQEMEVDVDSNDEAARKVSVGDQKTEKTRIVSDKVIEDVKVEKVEENYSHEVPHTKENKKETEGNEVGRSPQKLPSPKSSIDTKTNMDTNTNAVKSVDEKSNAGGNEESKKHSVVSSSCDAVDGNNLSGELKVPMESRLDVKTEVNNTEPEVTGVVVSSDEKPNTNNIEKPVHSQDVTNDSTAKEMNGTCNEHTNLVEGDEHKKEAKKGKGEETTDIQAGNIEESEELVRMKIKNAEKLLLSDEGSKGEFVKTKPGEKITVNAENNIQNTKTEEGSKVNVCDKGAQDHTSDGEKAVQMKTLDREEVVSVKTDDPACAGTKQAIGAVTGELLNSKAEELSADNPEKTVNSGSEEHINSKTEESVKSKSEGTVSAETEVIADKTEVTADKTDVTAGKTEVAADKTEVTVDKAKASADKTEVIADAKMEVIATPKMEVIAAAKMEVIADAKREVNADAKPEVTADAKTEITADAKTEVTANAKTEVSADAKTEVTADSKTEVTDNAQTEESVNAKTEVTASAEPEENVTAKSEVTGNVEEKVPVSTKTEENTGTKTNESREGNLQNIREVDGSTDTKTVEADSTNTEAASDKDEVASLKQHGASDPSKGNAEVTPGQCSSEVESDVQMTVIDVTDGGADFTKSGSKKTCIEEEKVVTSASKGSSENVKEGKVSEAMVTMHEMEQTSDNNEQTSENKPVKCNVDAEDTCEAMETDDVDEKMEIEDVAGSEDGSLALEKKQSKSELPLETCDSKSMVINKQISKENGSLNEKEASELGVKKVDSSDVPSTNSTAAQS